MQGSELILKPKSEPRSLITNRGVSQALQTLRWGSLHKAHSSVRAGDWATGEEGRGLEAGDPEQPRKSEEK